MKSRFVTDDVGQKLRATYFPYHIDKSVPAPTNGFGLRTKHMADKLGPLTPTCRPMRKPATLMIVDYNQDQQYIDQVVESGPFDTESDMQRNRLTIKPAEIKHQFPHPALPLRSTFVLKQKVDTSTPEMEMSVSQQLYNKQDAVTQTDVALERHNFKGVTDYNEWSNSTMEPFFKELRKAVRTHRPKDLNAYIVAYCNALNRGEGVPVTVDPDIQGNS